MIRITVKEIIQETPDTRTFLFDVSPSWDYRAGQYITFTHTLDGQRLYRSYSLSTIPGEDPHPGITVKRVHKGKFSNYLHDHIHVGSQLICCLPRGKFTLSGMSYTGHEHVFFAAGSGIVPIFAIMRDLLQQDPFSQVTLIDINRDQTSIIYHQKLCEVAEKYKGRLRVIHILTRPQKGWEGLTGRPTAQDIQEMIMHKKQATYWLCAPEDLMDFVYSSLFLAGVDTDKIHQELFSSPPKAPSEGMGVASKATVHTRGEIHTVSISPGEKLLDALLDAGLEVPFSCCGGLCTTCRVKCLAGKVDMLEKEGLSPEEEAEGYILSCVSYPTTGAITIDLDA